MPSFSLFGFVRSLYAAGGFEYHPFYLLPYPFYQGILYTENSHTPPFLDILSITLCPRHNTKATLARIKA